MKIGPTNFAAALNRAPGVGFLLFHVCFQQTHSCKFRFVVSHPFEIVLPNKEPLVLPEVLVSTGIALESVFAVGFLTFCSHKFRYVVSPFQCFSALKVFWLSCGSSS